MSELLAFSAEHIRRLTGLSDRQLRYWDQTGFFSPHYGNENRRRPYSRIYSFRDLVGLRIIALLRNKHHVPLPHLREVGRRLAGYPEASWSNVRFYVAGRRVFFDDPESGARMAAHPPGQTTFPYEMQEIVNETREEANRLRERSPAELGQVTHHRYTVHNAPILAGTRIPTLAVWNLHQAGYDTAAIIREYPRLTPIDVAAAIEDEERRRRVRTG